MKAAKVETTENQVVNQVINRFAKTKRFQLDKHKFSDSPENWLQSAVVDAIKNFRDINPENISEKIIFSDIKRNYEKYRKRFMRQGKNVSLNQLITDNGNELIEQIAENTKDTDRVSLVYEFIEETIKNEQIRDIMLSRIVNGEKIAEIQDTYAQSKRSIQYKLRQGSEILRKNREKYYEYFTNKYSYNPGVLEGKNNIPLKKTRREKPGYEKPGEVKQLKKKEYMKKAGYCRKQWQNSRQQQQKQFARYAAVFFDNCYRSNPDILVRGKADKSRDCLAQFLQFCRSIEVARQDKGESYNIVQLNKLYDNNCLTLQELLKTYRENYFRYISGRKDKVEKKAKRNIIRSNPEKALQLVNFAENKRAKRYNKAYDRGNCSLFALIADTI